MTVGPRPGEDDDELERIVAAHLEELSRGGDPDVDALCSRHPDLAEELRAVLGMRTALGALEPEEELPRQFGPFVLQRRLGRGGTGSVYEANEEELGRRVAIKLLRADASPSGRRRFLREARTMAALTHDHIVPIYSAGEIDGRPYLVMQLLERALHGHIGPDAERVSPGRAARWVQEAARGVAHLHAQKILHRDLKPANLLLDEDGKTRVGDLGLALAHDAERLTATRDALGTLGYASPEQLAGEPLDERCDVYGLGACLFALISGRPPPIQHRERDLSVLLGDTDVPAPLRAIVARATAWNREQRYAAAAELAEDLEAFAAGRAPAGSSANAGRWIIAALGGVLALAAGIWWMTAGPVAESSPSGELLAAPGPRAAPLGGWVMERWSDGDTLLPGRFADWVENELGPDRAAADPEPVDELRVEHGGDRYTARLTTERGALVAALSLDDHTVARVDLDLDDADWGVWPTPHDVDGDGLPDLVLRDADGDRWAAVAFERGAWRGRDFRTRIPGRQRYATPISADVDGDGTDELLVATSHTEANALSTGLVAVVDDRGGILSTWDLSAPVTYSMVAATPNGSPTSVFIPHAANFDPGIGWMTPGARGPTVAQHGLDGELHTSTLLQDADEAGRMLLHDADGDGVEELLVPSFSNFALFVHCFDTRTGEAMWSWSERVDAHTRMSHLLSSEQDGAPPREVCFAGGARFRCLHTQPDIEPQSRTLWSTPIPGDHDRVDDDPLELPDLDGDGVPEIAAAARSGQIHILSRSSTDGPLRSLPLPEPTREGAHRLMTTTGPVRSRAGDRHCLAVATMDGRLVCVPWDTEDAEPLWTIDLGHRIVATPAVMELPNRDPLLLAVSFGGWATIVQPPDRIEEEPEIVWSFRAEGALLARPRVSTAPDGGLRLQLFDDEGWLYSIDVDLPPPAD